MSDVERRLIAVERDVVALEARVQSNDADMRNIPDLVKLEFRLNGARFDRLERRIDSFEEGLSTVEHKVDALPRARLRS